MLLCFTVVNVAVLVLRCEKVGYAHFRTPTILAAALACAFLAGPVDRPRPG